MAIVLLDVDGTLVTYENILPDSAATAVRRARSRGHQVFLSTGRSRAEVPPELWELGIDGFIGGNGSYVEVAGQVIHHDHLTAAQTRSVVDWLTRRDLAFYLETNAGLFGSPNLADQGRPVIRRYIARKGDLDVNSLEIGDVLHGLVLGESLYRADVNKISFVLSSLNDHHDATAQFPDLISGTWGGRGAEALFGDLGVAGIDKATALDVLVGHLQADRRDTVAVGDGAVDIPLLRASGTGVAMGNAPDEVKAVADFVTTDVDENGLHVAFDRLGLLG
ncbi:MAG: HAD family hydrolase [Propioniciclava sp.]